LACSQDVVSFIEIEIKNTKKKNTQVGAQGELPAPFPPLVIVFPCCCLHLSVLLLLVSFGLLALLWLLWLLWVVVAVVVCLGGGGGGGVGVQWCWCWCWL
jgi:hypothetical protein